MERANNKSVGVISSKMILAGVVSRFGLESYPLQDGIEFIYDAIESIGKHLRKIYRTEIVDVDDYIVNKPIDFTKFHSILTTEGLTISRGLNNDIGYQIVNGNIVYTKRSGKVKLKYLSTGKDDEGFPLVRDTFKYRSAVTYYLLLVFFEQGNKHPTLDIRYALEQATKYKLQAKNEWNVTEDEVECIVNSWNMITPNTLMVRNSDVDW